MNAIGSWFWKDNTFVCRHLTFTDVHPNARSSQVISHLALYLDDHYNGAGIAYFYCDFTQNEFQCAKNVIGSLVAQLCSQMPYPGEVLVAYKDSLAPGKRRAPSWDILRRTLSWCSRDRKVLLLLDALDECGKREDILRFLCRLREENENISVFVTSREEADIEEAFRSCPRLRLENHRADVDKDIQSYIDQRLAIDASLKKLPLAVKADIKLSLIGKCIGM